jgi:hypothetical protein
MSQPWRRWEWVNSQQSLDLLAVSGLGSFQGLAELIHVVVAADKASQPTGRGGVKSGAHGTGADEFVDLHRRWQAFHGKRAKGRDRDIAIRQLERGGAEEDAARVGELLHPRGQVGRLAHRRVVHVEIAADGPHDDLSGVQADTDLDHGPVSAPQLFRVLLHALLHHERRIARPHCVVLVGDRRAEERHDPIAHYLVDGAFVPVDGLHHALEHRVEELARLLGIAVGEQFHRALEVGEEDRDLFALTLQRGLRVDDPFGKVLRRVGVG